MRAALLAVAVGLCTMGFVHTALAQGLPGGVIPRLTLRQHGLERAWVTQVDIVPGRSRIASMTLHKNLFFVQSDLGMLQAIDAETGRTMWRTQVGDRNQPSVAPGVSDEVVCVASGANLYVLNRSDGRIRWESTLEFSPSAGLAVGNDRVYVPSIDGRVESYTVTERKDGKIVVAEPRQNQLFLGVTGVPQTPCLLTPFAISVGTDSGSLFTFAPGQVGALYSVETFGEILAEPAYYKGHILVASRDQYVYCVREMEGDIVWRQSLDEPISQSPVVIGDLVYAVTERSGLHQLNAKDGEENWFVPGVSQFLSAGANRIYAGDRLGRIRVLDAATGRQLDVLATGGHQVKFTNTENDRIYLASSSGVLHCLREAALTDPVVYHAPAPQRSPETQQKPLEGTTPAAPKAPTAAAPADDAAADDAAEDDAAADEDAAAGDDAAEDAPADEEKPAEDEALEGFGEE